MDRRSGWFVRLDGRRSDRRVRSCVWRRCDASGGDDVSLYLPGTSGNYVSTPDHASLDITGDLGITAFIKLADWTPSVSLVPIVAKWTATYTNSAYYFRVNGTSGTPGQLGYLYTNGAARIAASTAIAGFTDDTFGWIGVTHNLSGGEVKFWIGGSASTPSWVELGTAVSGLSTSSRDTCAAPVTINQVVGGSEAAQTVQYAAVHNGIGANTAPGQGTLVAEFNATAPSPSGRYYDTTGKVWTINGSAWAWEVETV